MKNPEKKIIDPVEETREKPASKPYYYDPLKIPGQNVETIMGAKTMVLNDAAFVEIIEEENGTDMLKIHPNSNPKETIYYTDNKEEIDDFKDIMKNKDLGDGLNKK